MPPEEPVLVSRRVVHEGFSTFSLLKVRLSDGTELVREVEDHGDAVAVLPYDPERRSALLVRLFRAPLLHKGEPSLLVEAAAGLIDPGEAPEDAARREALEEAGVVLGELERIGRFWSSPGVSAERMTLYLAACSFTGRGAGGGLAEEHEDIEVLEIPLAGLARMMDAGEIADMKVLALAQALKLRRPDLF